ncbi:hypothetical protein IQ290_16245 [Burkholderia sp. R-70199]|nr:hypothetical protein [Burkholderia sp. R-70199]
MQTMTPEYRELIKGAALAAGFSLVWADDGSMCWLAECYDGRQNTDDPWNPLVSDVDAFRLGIRLGMDTGQGFEMAFATLTVPPADDVGEARHTEAHEQYSDHAGDIYAASRRAIVRTAAAMDTAP